MFDIGFAELLIIGIVALLVVGPEKLPSTIRTASLYLNRIRRGFNDIKREVQQELHNDSVMQDLRKTSEDLSSETKAIGNQVKESLSETEAIIDRSQHTPKKDTVAADSSPATPDKEASE